MRGRGSSWDRRVKGWCRRRGRCLGRHQHDGLVPDGDADGVPAAPALVPGQVLREQLDDAALQLVLAVVREARAHLAEGGLVPQSDSRHPGRRLGPGAPQAQLAALQAYEHRPRPGAEFQTIGVVVTRAAGLVHPRLEQVAESQPTPDHGIRESDRHQQAPLWPSPTRPIS